MMSHNCLQRFTSHSEEQEASLHSSPLFLNHTDWLFEEGTGTSPHTSLHTKIQRLTLRTLFLRKVKTEVLPAGVQLSVSVCRGHCTLKSCKTSHDYTICQRWKNTKITYSCKSTVTQLEFYSSTSKITCVKIYSNKHTK